MTSEKMPSALETFTLCYHAQCESCGANLCHTALRRVYAAVEQRTPNDLCALDLGQLYFGSGMTEEADDFHAFITALARGLHVPVGALTLSDTLIRDRGLLSLSQALCVVGPLTPAPRVRGLTHMTQLNLSGCGLRDVQYALPALLAACPHLSVLDLSGNRLGCGVASLASATTVAIAQHRSLSSVDLSHNFIEGDVSGEGMRGLCEMLVMAAARPRRCAPLVSLNLAHNQLGAGEDRTATPSPHGGDASSGSQAPLLSLHPLLDAILLNNDITTLSLEGNAMRPALLAWIEAKLNMNRQAQRRTLDCHRPPLHQVQSDMPETLDRLHKSFQRTVQTQTRAVHNEATGSRGGEAVASTWSTEEVTHLVADIFAAVRNAVL